MKKLILIVLGILIAVLAAFCAWEHFGIGTQKATTKAHSDKGSYSYYYSPPENSELAQEPSGIYFYSER